jgi:hypothetical protein
MDGQSMATIKVFSLGRIKGMLEKAASGVLALLPCSRTESTLPRVKKAAALLDGLF